MSESAPVRILSGLRAVRPRRLIALLLVALLTSVICDWARVDRVIFPAPLPKFVTVPSGR